jgi:hypothetical protein
MDKPEVTLGRAHTNDLCYPEDASLSRKHLRLLIDDSGLHVEDLGSKNGTLLNGVRVANRQPIRPGDRLVVGHIEITLVDSEQQSPVEFVPSSAQDQTGQGTVMTKLADLLSSEATAPILQPPARVGTPAQVDAPHSSIDSPVVRLLLRAGRELASHRPLEELFPLILDLSIEAVGAERGVVMTLEGERLVSKAVHGDRFRISEAVRDKVLNERASLLVRDMAQDEAFRQRLSISAQQIHTMMAVPLQTEAVVIGLIYVDSRLWMREFTPDDLNLLTFLGNIAATRIEQERFAELERESRDAAKIQERILPLEVPRVDGVEIAGHNAPCHTVGGDYYDFVTYEDGRVLVALADVAGKGMSAALLMSNLQARLQMLAEDPTDLGKLMMRLDRSLAVSCPKNRFITMFVSLIDPKSGEVVYVNAGHNPPLIARASGEVDRLSNAGTVLGILPDLGYEEQRTTLEPGDVLAMFSDGVTESIGTNGEEFGEEQLGSILVRHRDQEAAEVVDSVLANIREWTDAAPADDDVTLVVVRRKDG